MLLDTLNILLAASAIHLATASPTRVQSTSPHTFSLTKRVPESWSNLTTTERIQAQREADHVRRIFKRQSTGNVALTAKQGGSLWTMSPLLGQSRTAAVVQIDTGSSDLWSNTYTPTPGATQVGATNAFSIDYVDGTSAKGTCYVDRAEAGGLATTQQTVCAASGTAAKAGVNSGVIGFGLQGTSNSKAVPFVLNLKAAQQITRAVFGLRLTLTNAELYIGGSDTSRIAPGYTLQESPVLQDSQGAISEWFITMTAVTVGSKNILRGSVKALMDSGTSIVVGPVADIQNLYSAIPGSMTQAAYNQMAGLPAPTGVTTGYVLPCAGGTGSTDIYPRGPAISLTLAGTAWTIPYASLTTPNSDYTKKINGYQYCDGTFASMANTAEWIVGDTFLSNMYMEFDYDQSKVRLAYGQ